MMNQIRNHYGHHFGKMSMNQLLRMNKLKYKKNNIKNRKNESLLGKKRYEC